LCSFPPRKFLVANAPTAADSSQITSLQGKKLDQLYPKANEFHTSRRSWYLPISPSPDHPDANSKKAKKRFPTLALADGATLRWESYVNIRHVYKTDWAHLKPYSNLDAPNITSFQFDRESITRMIAKGKVLTLYEPGEQVAAPGLRTRRTAPPRVVTSTDSTSHLERGGLDLSSPVSEAGTAASSATTRTPTTYESDFRTLSDDGERSREAPPEEPPDPKARQSCLGRVLAHLFSRRRKG
jgi:hypothetical protein